MNNFRHHLCALLIALIALPMAFVTGCATSSTTASGGAYNLKQTRDDVDLEMSRYRNRLEFGFVTTEEQARVSAAYKTYQGAFNAAAKSVNMDLETRTPENVKELADGVMDALASIP